MVPEIQIMCLSHIFLKFKSLAKVENRFPILSLIILRFGANRWSKNAGGPRC